MDPRIMKLLRIKATATCLFLAACATPHNTYVSDGRHTHGPILVPGVEKAEGEDPFVTISAMGYGVDPSTGTPEQKKILANRAAVVDAYRNLAERITGVIVDAYTRQGNNSVTTDQVRLESSTYLRGAKVVGVDHVDGVSTATVRVVLPSNSTLFANKGIFYYNVEARSNKPFNIVEAR